MQRTNDTNAASTQRAACERGGGGVVFWMLILLALGVLTPCVLLPEWRQYQSLRQARQVQRHRVDLLEQRIDRERRLRSALRGDPAVIARLARREYGFHRAGERMIPVRVPRTAPPPAETFTLEPVPLPPLLAHAATVLPEGYDYDRIFCGDQTRAVLMVMSVALIAVAFALFSGRIGAHESRGHASVTIAYDRSLP